MTHLWKDVWPVLAAVSVFGVPAHTLSLWRLRVSLDRQKLQIMATLDRKMKIKLEVDEANEVKIVPLPPADPTQKTE